MPDYIETARNLTASDFAHPDVPGAIGLLKDQLDGVIAGEVQASIYGAGECSFATDEQLAEGSAKLQVLSASATGLSVKLPDATGAAMVLGQPWTIVNPAAAANAYDVEDFAGGTLLAGLAPGSRAILRLMDPGLAITSDAQRAYAQHLRVRALLDLAEAASTTPAIDSLLEADSIARTIPDQIDIARALAGRWLGAQTCPGRFVAVGGSVIFFRPAPRGD